MAWIQWHKRNPWQLAAAWGLCSGMHKSGQPPPEGIRLPCTYNSCWSCRQAQLPAQCCSAHQQEALAACSAGAASYPVNLAATWDTPDLAVTPSNWRFLRDNLPQHDLHTLTLSCGHQLSDEHTLDPRPEIRAHRQDAQARCIRQLKPLTPKEKTSTASVQPLPSKHSGAMYGKVPACHLH